MSEGRNDWGGLWLKFPTKIVSGGELLDHHIRKGGGRLPSDKKFARAKRQVKKTLNTIVYTHYKNKFNKLF